MNGTFFFYLHLFGSVSSGPRWIRGTPGEGVDIGQGRAVLYLHLPVHLTRPRELGRLYSRARVWAWLRGWDFGFRVL